MAFFSDGVLAFTKSVPELDGLVTGRRDDLTVIWREADRENVVCVADKSTGSLSSSNVPETKGLVYNKVSD